MDRTDRHGLPYVQEAQAQKHVTVNDVTRALDALLHPNVRSRTIADEPATPSAGDGYILTATPAGANWTTLPPFAIAVFQDGAWAAYPARAGLTAFVEAEARSVVFDGSAWVALAADANIEAAPRFGVNAVADPTNRLVVKSDAVLHSHDDQTPGSGDARHVINKAASTNTASHLFQTGFAARAEFGLTGTDDFVIKVSPDGSTFFDALIIDRVTGSVRFPHTPAFVGGTPGGGGGPGPGPGPFNPANLAGLVGWYDPSDASARNVTGSAVSALTDRSGNNASATQTNPADQPILASALINGRDAVSFNGTQYLLANALAPAISGDDKAFSVHLVFQTTNTVTTQIFFSAGNSADADSTFWAGVLNTGSYRLVKRKGPTSTQLALDYAPSDLAPHVLSIVHKGTTTDVWLDGFRVLADAPHDVAAMPIDRVAFGAWLRTSESFNFLGALGEILVFDRATSDADTRSLQRYLGDRWLNLPQTVDLMLAMGQSNMRGKGLASQGVAAATRAGYWYADDNSFPVAKDPVYGADTGSALPAFANEWQARTGRTAVFVQRAIGGSALIPSADSGNGNWNKTGGTLYATAISGVAAARQALSTYSVFGTNRTFMLWAQGERDAQALDSGNGGVTEATYTAALNTLIADLRAELAGGLTHSFIFELGTHSEGLGEASWAIIRAAQGTVAAADPAVSMVFTNAKNFAAQGKMSDTLHYNQTGYNEMGTQGAIAAAGAVGG